MYFHFGVFTVGKFKSNLKLLVFVPVKMEIRKPVWNKIQYDWYQCFLFDATSKDAII